MSRNQREGHYAGRRKGRNVRSGRNSIVMFRPFIGLKAAQRLRRDGLREVIE